MWQAIPVAKRSKAWVCGFLLAGIAGSNPHRSHGCLLLGIVVCCQVEFSSAGRSPIQSSPTECVCVSMIEIRCNNKAVHLRYVGRIGGRGETNEKKGKTWKEEIVAYFKLLSLYPLQGLNTPIPQWGYHVSQPVFWTGIPWIQDKTSPHEETGTVICACDKEVQDFSPFQQSQLYFAVKLEGSKLSGTVVLIYRSTDHTAVWRRRTVYYLIQKVTVLRPNCLPEKVSVNKKA